MIQENNAPATPTVDQSLCRILFVCTGNTCRSPLAEALCKKQLAERLGCSVAELPARGFFVHSAGLAAMIGASAASEAVATAQAYGADLAAHATRPVTAEMIAQSDYIVAMTQVHLQTLSSFFPESTQTARLLTLNGDDIPDPVGCARPVYEECARKIWTSLEDLVEEIVAQK